jgi:hypothetical protein
MQHEIIGSTMPVLEIQLAPQEHIRINDRQAN